MKRPWQTFGMTFGGMVLLRLVLTPVYAHAAPLACASCMPSTGDYILKFIIPVLVLLIVSLIVLFAVRKRFKG